jgi:4-hydroxy-tetrahydrodipicolinate reductase
MKIALLGYGRMGKAIEEIAGARGHEIVLRKDIDSGFDCLETADVAIDFSVPGAARENIVTALNLGIPVVSGTTGWLEDYDFVTRLCQEKNGALVYGSNYSIGVNLFFQLNEIVAKMMAKFPEYKIEMQEIHHLQKVDSPSGTAITLANGIVANSTYKGWALDNQSDDEILIDVARIGHVPGTHAVFYKSLADLIQIKHVAHSREGFAYGAVIAAEWIIGKRGVFSPKEVFGISN